MTDDPAAPKPRPPTSKDTTPSDAPDATSPAPDATSPAPDATSPAPDATSPALDAVASQPSTAPAAQPTAHQPAALATQPTAHQPAALATQPSAAAALPSAAADQPSAVADQPSAAQPPAVAAQPPAVAAQPPAVAAQPPAVAAQPAVASEHTALATGADRPPRLRTTPPERLRTSPPERLRTSPPAAFDHEGWPLDSSESMLPMAEPAPAPPSPAPAPQMPSPAAAAYEAARIVGEMVGDIESAPGAALVAAAAAGAAIEVARARVAAGEPDRSLPPTSETASGDPAITVRMQRDRILRALAEDIAANATSTATAEAEAAAAAAAAATTSAPAAPAASPATPVPGRATSQPGVPVTARDHTSAPPIARATTQPPRDDASISEEDDDRDPVAIAAAAIARLRARARTDLAELRVHYHRHDVLVLVVAFLIIVVTGRVHLALVTPDTEPFDATASHGLAFEHAKGWLRAPSGPLPAPRIVHDVVAPSASKPSDLPYREELTSTLDPTARIEVIIDKKPAWSNIVTGLDLDRRTRWGELYALEDSAVPSIEDHQWLRTAYRYAHVADKGDVPRIDRAVEYATIDRDQIYVITLFGTPAAIERVEEVVAPTLRVATQTGLPLVPQTGHLSTRRYPNAVSRAFESTVMVVVADLVDGKLRARGGGSGVIVGRDGSILTNYHVIHDQNGRLHDVFVIGRFSEQDKAPQLHCAGKPSRSKLQRELDLALIKCDLDLDGRSWLPTTAATPWPTLTQAPSADIKIGQRLWVLGYPDVGGGGLTLSEGEVDGWSGVDGAVGRDFLKTDAAIRHGNSGGPVLDDAGRLVGIASAVRTKQNAAGRTVEIVQAGGRIRPIAAATDLLAIAAAGWVPRDGHTDVELQPSAIEAPAEGVQIQSRVVDLVNEAPVRDALVMVMRPGVTAATIDVNRLDDQVLSYGRSNAQGEVLLRQPVPAPGRYTLMVMAHGYEPIVGDGALALDAGLPDVFDPWGKLLMRAR